ncbi:MAG: RHS repeat-associated core domain-containing protein [Pseudomonadota bacterium]
MYTLTNYGLIRAEDLEFIIFGDNQNLRCVIMKGLPDHVDAKERLTVPFRLTCLASPAEPESGGGGEGSGSGGIGTPYKHKCGGGRAIHIWGGPGVGAIEPEWQQHSGGPPTMLGFGGRGGKWKNMCANGRPKPKGPGGSPDGPEPPKRDPDCTHSLLDPLRGTYEDTITDLSVKIPGHRINVLRSYYDDRWHLNHPEQGLELVIEDSDLAYISKTGVLYSREDEQSTVFTSGSECRIYVEEDGYRWEDKSGNWIEYDPSGRMLFYGDRNGLKVSAIYDAVDNNRLTGLADNQGRQVLWYEYLDGKVSVVQDASGRRVEYYYEAGKLTQVKDVLGYETFYTYDSAGRLATKEDPEGRKVFITYDGNGFVAGVTDDNGIGQFWDYADDGGWEFYTLTRASGGKVIERWFDSEGRKKRKDINGHTIETILRDGRNEIFRDAGGRETYREFDEWENLIKETYPDGSSVSYEYEAGYANATKKIDERGIVTTYQYDGGNLLRQVDAAGTNAERITEYTYDSDGNRLTIKQVGDVNTPDAVTVMTYDTTGNVESITDPEGNTSWFTHDIMGHILTKTDGRGKIWSYEYDGKGQLASSKDPLENITQFFYDKVGNKVKEIDAEAKQITYQYDNEDNLLTRITPSGVHRYEYNLDGLKTKETDPEEKAIRYEYDLEGRMVKTIDGNGNEVINEYGDTAGGCASCAGLRNQPKRTIFPTFTREYNYDRRGRRTEEEDILSGLEEYSTSFTYDTAGNLITKVDKEGKTTRYEYDQLNRLIKVTDPLQQETKYTYDDRNNLIASEDANHNVTQFEYDRNSRLIKEKRPMGQETVYQYNGAGNLIAKTDAKNQRIGYEYDDAGRLITTRYFSAEDHATPTKTVTFSYSKLGKLMSYADGATSAQYDYDDSHRKTFETVNYGTFELTYSYTYYGNGKKKSFTAPGGITYEYTYDAASQLESVLIPGQGYITYNSYTWTRPSNITLPGGTTKEYTYDPLMRIGSITVKDPAQSMFMNYGYIYDRADNILRKETEHGIYDYTYDDLYRLTNVYNSTLPDETYTYDPVGNRLTAAEVPGNWVYNANNELLSYGDTAHQCDENGNTIQRASDSQTVNSVYNIENRLVRVKDGGGGEIASYYYDPFGRRLWKEVGGTRTYFLYSDEGLIGEYDGSGTEIKAYGYKPDSTWTTDPLFMKQGGQYYFYHNDHLGTPMQLTASNGAVVWSAKYEAFGEVEVDSGSTMTNNLRFPGQYYDQETGLHYNYHRDYAPDIGRYIEADPIGLEGGYNAYLYVSNNAITRNDPLGLKFFGKMLDCGQWETVPDASCECGARLVYICKVYYCFGWVVNIPGGQKCYGDAEYLGTERLKDGCTSHGVFA